MPTEKFTSDPLAPPNTIYGMRKEDLDNELNLTPEPTWKTSAEKIASDPLRAVAVQDVLKLLDVDAIMAALDADPTDAHTRTVIKFVRAHVKEGLDAL